ncbi:CvpA family protein [Solemya velesiana gill symbiont]|uniref:Colicin V production CvpA n=1 Tax=Solemya velesiana gill symbiont TaxID=1918948 RepID=A0A1T2KUY5_9GAMM|nr:CvpA family protein [Solemya velesiana gill symbiont]OOZ36611.1 colicin V production CvpA [Solemya velesiana gill symbiont]
MIWIDYAIIGIIGLSALISLIRGFISEALSLAVWVLAFWVAWTFFRELSVQLDLFLFTVPSVRLGAAFAILFIATLMLGALINFLVGQLVEKTGLSGTDRLIGIFFGAARGAVLIAILVLLAGLTPFPNDPWWKESHLIVYFQELAIWLKELLPADIGEKFNFA